MGHLWALAVGEGPCGQVCAGCAEGCRETGFLVVSHSAQARHQRYRTKKIATDSLKHREISEHLAVTLIGVMKLCPGHTARAPSFSKGNEAHRRSGHPQAVGHVSAVIAVPLQQEGSALRQPTASPCCKCSNTRSVPARGWGEQLWALSGCQEFHKACCICLLLNNASRLYFTSREAEPCWKDLPQVSITPLPWHSHGRCLVVHDVSCRNQPMVSIKDSRAGAATSEGAMTGQCVRDH